jgi:cell division protein FtsB
LSGASGPAGAAGASSATGATGAAGLKRPRGPARADSSRPVLLAAVLLFVVLLGAAGLKSYRDLAAARVQERQLESRIEETRNGIDRLRSRILRLRSDPAMLERLAREDLGLVRSQDVVIELPPLPPLPRDDRREPAAPPPPPARP